MINDQPTHPPMKLSIKNPFLLAALTAGISLTLARDAAAQAFRAVYTFPPITAGSDTDGSSLYGGLLLSGSTLYGSASSGGASSNGTVFAVGTGGKGFTVLHSFSAYKLSSGAAVNSDGGDPMAGLVLSGNTLYGTTVLGGSAGDGTIFAVNTDGTGFTTLHNFTDGGDGKNPLGALVVSNGALYGTASEGGSGGGGTVFALYTNGTGFTTLHSFTGGADGSVPSAGLILSGNTLYGTASQGGASGSGAVFALHTDGTGFVTLHNFGALNNDANSDGADPMSGLILLGDTLYGTAFSGGAAGNGTVFAIGTNGSSFATLYNFSTSKPSGTNKDGANPRGDLALSGSTLYGTTYDGGLFLGTVFAVNVSGTGFKTLYAFPRNQANGSDPAGGVIITGDTLYGTTRVGGDQGFGGGTIFAVAAGPASPPPKTFVIKPMASPAHAGVVTGGGSYPTGASATLTAASTNGCYQFIKWTIGARTVSTNANYSFIPTASEAVVANFSPFEYTIQTAISPAQGGITSGGGVKACDSLVTLTARAKPGFKFTNWVANGVVQSEKPTFNFTVDSAATVTANFLDIAPPRVTITSPAPGLRTTSGAITISGKAQDNVAVAGVYYQDSLTGGWTLAQETGNDWSTWSAQVSLAPGANVIDVYAVDSSGNSNAPVSVRVSYAAPPGAAPPSLSGYVATVTQGGGKGTIEVSFGTSTFAQVPLDTNDTGRVGNYTYAPNSPDTAELVLSDAATPSTAAKSNAVLLTFTKSATGSLTGVFTNSDGSAGTIALTQASEFAPASLSGMTVQVNEQNGPVFTNVFADGAFTSTDSLGISAGAYTYIPYGPVGGLIEEVFTGPAALAGSTNFIVVVFSQSNAGNYYVESYINGPGAAPSSAIGTFTVLGAISPRGEIAPASLNGLTATVKAQGSATFALSYGLSTFGTTSFGNTNSIGVGNYTYTRVGTNTAVLEIDYTSPPPLAGATPGPITLTFSGPETASFTAAQLTGAISLAPAQNTAPQSLAGKTFNATLPNGKKASLSFGDGTFTGVGTTGSSSKNSGTYTFAIYAPSLGMAQLTYTDAADSGLTDSLQLEFATATSGTFYTTQINGSGAVTTAAGTFAATTTPQ